MESTGIYWVPLFELLESRGFEVYLVEPRQARHAPGRPKSDVLDCQWLQRLHSYGLLTASFRPADSAMPFWQPSPSKRWRRVLLPRRHNFLFCRQ
jgi:transposase